MSAMKVFSKDKDVFTYNRERERNKPELVYIPV